MSRQSYSANQYSGGGSSSRSTSAPAGGASAGGNYGGESITSGEFTKPDLLAMALVN